MEKITLAGKDYELPEINFGAMRKLGKLGFNISDLQNIQDHIFDVMASMVAFITDSTLGEADVIIENSFTTSDEFTALTEKLVTWFANSDFFKKMQASKENK